MLDCSILLIFFFSLSFCFDVISYSVRNTKCSYFCWASNNWTWFLCQLKQKEKITPEWGMKERENERARERETFCFNKISNNFMKSACYVHILNWARHQPRKKKETKKNQLESHTLLLCGLKKLNERPQRKWIVSTNSTKYNNKNWNENGAIFFLTCTHFFVVVTTAWTMTFNGNVIAKAQISVTTAAVAASVASFFTFVFFSRWFFFCCTNWPKCWTTI